MVAYVYAIPLLKSLFIIPRVTDTATKLLVTVVLAGAWTLLGLL